MSDPDSISYFAETDYRNKKTKFGIKANDRSRHVYIIGKTGMGKSTLLENLAIQDIQAGNGVGFIDPHGSTAEKLLEYVPEHRIKDVIYFAPFDADYPVSFNVMEDVGKDKRHLVVSGLMSAFKKIWVDAWSARMEYILTNTLLALIEYPGSTLLGVNRMLSDKDYRAKVVANISDPSVKSFWVDEFEKYSDRYKQEALPPIQNKVGQFISNPIIRNVIGQPKSTFDIRDVMDHKKILIMNLSKGRLGEQNSKLIGGMLITKIYLGAMSRADLSEQDMKRHPPFYFYVDEFQSFANESFAEILSESRKYKLALTIANQYMDQMPEEIKSAVIGNVGTTIAFRIGALDAELFEKEFAPMFVGEDLVNLGFAQIYLKLMIDGIGSKPFSATTLPPHPKLERSFKDEILTHSRQFYARPREVVEGEIKDWHAPLAPSDTPKREPPRDRPYENQRSDNHQPSQRSSSSDRPPRNESSYQGDHKKETSHSHTESRHASSNHNTSHVAPHKEHHREADHPKKEGEKKFALKEALERAMKEQKEIIEKQNERLRQGATNEQKEEPVAPPAKKEDTLSQGHEETKKDSIREVPEDVLRKVLE